ncbi:MAG: AAA family ATPase [Patescibacteria group bacterium]
MYIKKLTIKNFRCFGRDGITVPLNDKATALIGRNGSGKTSILEALNYLLGQDYLPTRVSEKDFHPDAKGTKEIDAILIEGETASPFYVDVDVISDRGIASTVVVPCDKIRLSIKRREKADRVLDDPFIINKTVVPILGTINDSIYQSNDFKKSYKVVALEEVDTEIDDLDKAKEVIKNLLKGTASSTEQFERYYQVTFKLKSGEERSATFPSYALGFNPNRIKFLAKAYYLTKDRDSDVSGNYSLISKILTDLHWRYKKKHTGGDGTTIEEEYEKLAGSLRSIVDEKGVLIKKINDKVRAICSDDKCLQIDFIDIEQPYRSAFIAKQEGNKLLIPNNLGSGFNILIAYALFSYVADLEKLPIVLVIDEPELHLHCDWQRKMYNLFSEQSKIQIVYSTQSENFVSLKNWREIRLLSDLQLYPREEELNTLIQATDGESSARAEYLDDYAKKNLHISTILKENLELLFTKKCLLVEGPSEKYALPKLLKLSECNIEDYSISIVPCWGKTKIKNYQMICKVFGVDYFTLFDSDKVDDDELDNENTAIESNAIEGKLLKFSSSFENKLGVNGDSKFQKLVRKIDELEDVTTLDTEIQTAVNSIKSFIKDEGI